MSAQTSRYESDTLPAETADVVVIGGGAASLNGAQMPGRSRRSLVAQPATADTDAALAAAQAEITPDCPSA